MPRFFFDLVAGEDEFRDEEGLEFSDASEATIGAQAAAEDLRREAAQLGVTQSPHTRYEIYDDSRVLVAWARSYCNKL